MLIDCSFWLWRPNRFLFSPFFRSFYILFPFFSALTLSTSGCPNEKSFYTFSTGQLFVPFPPLPLLMLGSFSCSRPTTWTAFRLAMMLSLCPMPAAVKAFSSLKRIIPLSFPTLVIAFYGKNSILLSLRMKGIEVFARLFFTDPPSCAALLFFLLPIFFSRHCENRYCRYRLDKRVSRPGWPNHFSFFFFLFNLASPAIVIFFLLFFFFAPGAVLGLRHSKKPETQDTPRPSRSFSFVHNVVLFLITWALFPRAGFAKF